MKKILTVSGSYVIQNLFSAKMLASFIIIIAAVYLRANPLLYYSDYLGYNINFGMVVFIISDSFVLTVIFVAMVFIFSDIPFKNPKQYFILTRMGRRKWILAHVIYVITISTIVVIVILGTFALILGGHIYFGNSWGKIVSSIARNTFTTESGINILIYEETLASIDPHTAIAWTLINSLIIFSMFGNICISFNLCINEYMGTIMCGIFVFLHMLRSFNPDFIMTYISPIDWISVNNIDVRGNSAMPDWYFPIIVYFVAVICICTLNIYATSKKSIIIEKIL